MNKIQQKQLTNLPSNDKYSSRKEWESACWQKILKFGELLELLATSHERHDLVMRAAILKELMSGKGPRQISRELFVSFQTICVVKKAIGENSYRTYPERKERKKKKYSVFRASSKPKWQGRPKRTKYGKVYMPY